MKRNAGATLIELGIVIALMGVIGLGGFVFFRHTFETWWTTRDIVELQSNSRAALDEISRFVRQASTAPITVSGDGESIKFEIGKSTAEWSHNDLRVKYFKSGNTLERFMKGSTTTLVSEGITLFQVVHSTDSRYESVQVALELMKREEQADFSKNIVLRGRRRD